MRGREAFHFDDDSHIKIQGIRMLAQQASYKKIEL